MPNISYSRLLPQPWLVCFLTASMLWLASLAAHAQTTVPQDYRLGAGDTVRVQVFQNPDLTVEARVSETGSISVPLIGSIAIGGLSTVDAERRIADALKTGGFLQQPQVNIVLLQVRGNLFSVLGQVHRPGRFPLEVATTRVSDALAIAGGALPTGDDVVVLSGMREGKPYRKLIDIPALFLTEEAAENLFVSPGDTLYIHRAPVFYIYGEAQRSGPYRIERNMTVMQGMATAGGPTNRGSESRLRLHRRNASGVVEQTTPELTDMLQPNDVIYVRESLF